MMVGWMVIVLASRFLQRVKMGRVLLLVCLTLVSVAVCSVWGASEPHVTPVQQCPGQNYENLQKVVNVTNCNKSKCKLRKGTSTTVSIRFRPTKKIENIITTVYANILGLDLPFIGVTGNSACGLLKNADSGEPASCPLTPDTEYLYTNVFPIEQFYPSTSLMVHWSLTDGDKDVICFEIPAIIK